MGKKIIMWSPVHGQSATTSNTVALASMFALDEHYHSLLTQTQLTFSTLEHLYTKGVRAGFDDGGMEALERLVKSKLLKAEAIPDYTDTIYKNRLDLLVGSKKEWENQAEAENILRSILHVASHHYDTIWIDAHSGTFNSTTRVLLKEADLVVVNLPQNAYVIDHFFSGDSFPEELEGKPYIVIISNYDDKSAYSIKNIKRSHKVKVPIYPILYSTSFRDASNQRGITDFFLRSIRAKKGDSIHAFIQSVRDVNKIIMKQLKLSHTEDDDL